MIAYVSGKVLYASNGTVVIENNGIGYEICCSSVAYNVLTTEGGGVYTYLAVREDGLFLYGFSSLAEKAMFLKLISVSGVGPKLGMTILGQTSLNDLAFYIASSDVKSLSALKGLGKKTAERIIVELRETIGKEELTEAKKVAPTQSGESDNAVLALMSLGYTRVESVKAVEAAATSGAKSLEELITTALRWVQ